jgi:hypothetical protein
MNAQENKTRPNIARFFRYYFYLRKDKENELETIANIRAGVEFKGANLWILIFAILIASLGLNINSTAVVIGAMLISPLMGPLIGMGLSLGINDYELLKKSLKVIRWQRSSVSLRRRFSSSFPLLTTAVGIAGPYLPHHLRCFYCVAWRFGRFYCPFHKR